MSATVHVDVALLHCAALGPTLELIPWSMSYLQEYWHTGASSGYNNSTPTMNTPSAMSDATNSFLTPTQAPSSPVSASEQQHTYRSPALAPCNPPFTPPSRSPHDAFVFSPTMSSLAAEATLVKSPVVDNAPTAIELLDVTIADISVFVHIGDRDVLTINASVDSPCGSSACNVAEVCVQMNGSSVFCGRELSLGVEASQKEVCGLDVTGAAVTVR